MKKRKINPGNTAQYLILRFILVLIFIYFSNIFIDWLIKDIIFPVLEENLYISKISIEGGTISGILKLFILTVFGTLISRFPAPLDGIVMGALQNGLNINFVTPKTITKLGIVDFKISYIMIILIFVALFLLSLTPYIVGGVWFLQSVWAKVTELVMLDREKTRAYEEKRNLLLSDIAHDIKTPITAMSGYAKALNDGLVPEEKKGEYLNSIYSKSMRVSELINMMFEYIKLDSAGYSLNLEKSDVAELVRMVAAENYPDFEESGIEFEVDIVEKPLIRDIDGTQFARVISNLLGNALKYLEVGNKVRIATLEMKQAGSQFIEIVVEDNGYQIDDKLAEDIFIPFSRGDETRSTKGGTGLGLSIASKIVELHKGTLELDRNRTDGYTKAFVIRL